MSASPKRPDEFTLIERHFAPLAAEGAFAFRDDAARLAARNHDMAITQDAIATGVHFLASDPPDLVAKKALRVNLSDLAAKGATPFAISLALGLPDDWTEEWVAGFARGVGEDCRKYGVGLTGGDTFRAPGGPVIAITALGAIEEGEYRSRLAAKPGDRLMMTGTIGDGALGLLAHRQALGETTPLAALGQSELKQLEQCYLLPDPPVALALTIARFASAAIDISDGFVGDLEKLARASGFDATVDLAAIPFSQAGHAARAIDGMLEIALGGGDDYQILFTAREENRPQIERAASQAGVTLAILGTVRAGQGEVAIRNADGEPLRFAANSWDHFR